MPVRATRRSHLYRSPLLGISSPSFSHDTVGSGSPSDSHSSIVRMFTVAAIAVAPSSIVGGTARQNVESHPCAQKGQTPWSVRNTIGFLCSEGCLIVQAKCLFQKRYPA